MHAYPKRNNEKDLLILSHLRRDARMKLTDMSKQTKIAVSTLFDRITMFIDKGLVRKYTSTVDFKKLGYQAKVLILFSCKKKCRQDLQTTLERHPSLNSLYKVNNGWDFMAELVFSGVKEVEDFIEEVEEKVTISKKGIFYIIDELKKEEFLAKPQVLGLIR